jgi:hypothetical protein
MSRITASFMRTTVGVLGIGLLLSGRAGAQTCLGDCNGDIRVTAGELTKIVAVILNCPGSPSSGCAAVPGGCPNADRPPKDGKLTAGEETQVVFNSLNFFPSGCPPTPTVQPSSTPPPTATPTATEGVPVCGNKIVEGDEECDDGGICTGGTDAGKDCKSESDCRGSGVCVSGSKLDAACANDDACPGGQCVKCRPFGGDGCAANCTFEKTITYTLKPGQLVKRCTAGVNQSLACAADADCPGSKCALGGCLGGANDGKPCTKAAECPGGRCISQVLDQTTTGAFLQDGVLNLALPITGQQSMIIGGVRDGMITGVIKAASSILPAIKVGSLACACVRSVAVKTCGGTIFNEDGSIATSCTPDYTAGESLCAGKKPCAFVHGPGNATTGLIGCNGLTGIDLTFTQDAGMKPGDTFPPAPTPQPNSKPPVITLTGTGGPGSALLLNSSALGTTANGPNPLDLCVDTTMPPHPDFGADGKFCTDDDPQSTRGTPATLPQVTGTATGEIFNTTSSTSGTFNIGPYSYTGNPYNCDALVAPTPSVSGGKVVGAFCALNQPQLHDIVVRNIFVAQ